MLEHLCTPENRIEVKEVIIDRNQDTIAEIVIGVGYGIFRGQSQIEYMSQASAKFKNVGTLVFYEPTNPAPITIGGKQYRATHMYPKENDICVWRDTRYTISGVDSRPDVHGDIVGYTVRCSSG